MCSVTGCDSPAYAAGMCSKHYIRHLRTGTTDPGPRAKAPLAERLWRNVIRGSPQECWPWVGKSRLSGYGFIGRGGRGTGKLLAHRAAWEVTYGPIPDSDEYHGTVVRHTCDNRLCCNPQHLALGTQADNVRDMDVRGGRRTVARNGEAHHNARFTEADIRYIRSSPKRNVDLAKEYGVQRAVISGIRRRVSWRHVD